MYKTNPFDEKEVIVLCRRFSSPLPDMETISPAGGEVSDCTMLESLVMTVTSSVPSQATCYRVGPGQHNCTCLYGYLGNGYSCLGSVAKVSQ